MHTLVSTSIIKIKSTYVKINKFITSILLSTSTSLSMDEKIISYKYKQEYKRIEYNEYVLPPKESNMPS